MNWLDNGSSYGWTTRGSLPTSMLGTRIDTEKKMGLLFTNAPGPRASLAEAARLGKQEPSGPTNDRAWNPVTCTSRSARSAVLAIHPCQRRTFASRHSEPNSRCPRWGSSEHGADER